MISSMEVSLYPLGEGDIGPAIGKFISVLEEKGCSVETGPMSSLVTGDSQTLFEALGAAYEGAASDRGVVMVVKVSNACPL